MKNVEDLGEIVAIHNDMFRQAVTEQGFKLREVHALMRSYGDLNEDYLSHRLKKGSCPIKVFRVACEVIGVNYKDYVVEYDLSDVPTYQLSDELKARKKA